MEISKIFGFICIFFAVLILILVIIAQVSRDGETDIGMDTIPYASSKIACHPNSDNFAVIKCDPSTTNECNSLCQGGKGYCVTAHYIKNGEKSQGLTTESICLSSTPPLETCNAKTGGILTYTADVDAVKWGCLCAYPHIYNGPACDQKVPSYCSGGTIDPTWDATEGPPEKSKNSSLCQCPKGKVLLYRNGGDPFCVDSEKLNFADQSGFYPCSKTIQKMNYPTKWCSAN